MPFSLFVSFQIKGLRSMKTMSRYTASLVAGPSSEDWEARRPQFVQLYLEEGRKLKDVMAIMNRSGFKATEKMYKSRITKWGLDKKMKEHEARTIMQMHAQRHGRPTKITLRGRTVDINRVESYLMRKGLSMEDISNAATVTSPNKDLTCRTPSPAPSPETEASLWPEMDFTLPKELFLSEPQESTWTSIPPRIEGSNGLTTVEYLFADIAEYMTGCSRTGAWFAEDDADKRIFVFKGPDPAIGHLVHYTRSAVELSSTDIAGAGQTLRGAFTAIDCIIKGQVIETVQEMLKLIAFLTENGSKRLACFLCRVISALACSEHAKDYRILTPVFGRVFSRLALVIESQHPHHLVWEAAQRVTTDSIEAIVSLRTEEPSALISLVNMWYCFKSTRSSIDPDLSVESFVDTYGRFEIEGKNWSDIIQEVENDDT